MAFDGPFTLVLSGGGLKGLAHVGVLRALEERGLTPSMVVGTSMGSLVAAAWASGMPLSEMAERGLRVKRRDIFQVAHVDMALKRMQSPAVYRREPLDHLIRSLVGDRTFNDLERPLLVNTVELNTGSQVLWGLPGLRNVRVADAVFASCALPGILPPREIEGRFYVDGAVTENLPVQIAAAQQKVSVILAVDVGGSGVLKAEVQEAGFAATYLRGYEIVMQTLMETRLRLWRHPTLILCTPRVEHMSLFAFGHNRELIDEGYRATADLLDSLKDTPLEGGVYPRKRVQIRVDRSRCTGCGMCAIHAPEVFRMAEDGRAEVIAPVQTYSPLDGGYVRDCPTYAISVRLAPPGV